MPPTPLIAVAAVVSARAERGSPKGETCLSPGEARGRVHTLILSPEGVEYAVFVESFRTPRLFLVPIHGTKVPRLPLLSPIGLKGAAARLSASALPLSHFRSPRSGEDETQDGVASCSTAGLPTRGCRGSHSSLHPGRGATHPTHRCR